MNTFSLLITTPHGQAYSGEIEQMSFPAPDGRVGLLKGALPTVYQLVAGEIVIKTPVLESAFDCGDGLVIARGDSVSVISERCGERDTTVLSDLGDDTGKIIRAAKAKLASSIRGMREKGTGDDV